MTTLIFDTETNGLLNEATMMHCICITTPGSKEVHSFHNDPEIPAHGSLQVGLDWLAEADELVAHNLCGFDYPVLRKLFPYWDVKEGCVLTDTLRLSKLHFSDLYERDQKRKYQGFPGHMFGRHSLGAWGIRLGNEKDDYSGGWDKFTLDMLTYCQQDVRVLKSLHSGLLKQGGDPRAWALENAFADELDRANLRGVMLDVDKTEALYAKLTIREAEVHAELRDAFDDFEDEVVVPPSPRGKYPVLALQKHGWWPTALTKSGKPRFTKAILDELVATPSKWQGAAMAIRDEQWVLIGPVTETKVTEFNPSSRAHLIRHLRAQGWEPDDEEYTPTGIPILSEAVLERMDVEKHPQVPLILEHLLLDKRIGQIGRGRNAWLKLVGNDGIMHPYVNHIGTITFRCSHSKPNVGQVPASRSPYGKECRECWVPRPGYVLLGSDAAAVEFRILAHYLAPFDDGALIEVIESGADMHTRNMELAGLDNRDFTKMATYGTLYGMGPASLGKRGGVSTSKARSMQKKLVGALKVDKLEEGLKAVFKRKGYLKGLDGRRVPVRTQRALLNTLIQSGASVLIKQWTVCALQNLRAAGLDAHLVLHVHDELQIEAPPAETEAAMAIVKESMTEAGTTLGLRVTCLADASTGASWADTH